MSFNKFMFENKGSTTLCSEIINTKKLEPDWAEAFDHCKNYRDYMASLSIDDALKVNSYLLKREDIDLLLAQGEGNLDGIRIYIGRENFKDQEFAIRLFAVACAKTPGQLYEDWQVPKRTEIATALTKIGELRPCPDECSGSNGLSKDS